MELITAPQIQEAINRLLVGAFPNTPVHINLCPQNFTRPAFLIEMPTLTRRGASCGLVQETCYLTITCFAPKDRHSNSDTEDLLRTALQVLELFRPGYLQAGQRALGCDASTGGIDFATAWVDVQCSYYQPRGIPAPALPMMGDIQTKITKEE